MNTEHLIKMANQIAGFFESYPDQIEASHEIANHLKKFWAPRMRSELLDYIDHHQGAGLSATLLASITSHRNLIQP